MISIYGNQTGKALEVLSHSEAPYNAVDLYQVIPYEYSFYRDTPNLTGSTKFMVCNKPFCFVHHPKFNQELGDFIAKHAPSTTIEETITNLKTIDSTFLSKKCFIYTQTHRYS